MDSESRRSAQSEAERQKQIELEWDRLQSEALAAQHHRLEQEMNLARSQDNSAEKVVKESIMGLSLSNSWLAAGLLLLGCVSFAIVAYAWW